VALHVNDLQVQVAGRCLFSSVSMTVEPGSTVAIMGPSGSGKTSLINAIAGLVPHGGSVAVNGVDVSALSDNERSRFRLRAIGMIFQDSDLLPELTVIENAELPGRLLGEPQEVYRTHAEEALVSVGLRDRHDAWPSDLSGGERQRVAIARALNNHPSLILADEPTGALDGTNRDHVTDMLVGIARSRHAVVLIATHDPAVAAKCDQTLLCHSGDLLEEHHARA
jgi:lipoprotein-releasing system ATP-binding protein